MTRARSTNGRSLSESVWARMILAVEAQLVIPTTMTITKRVVRTPKKTLPEPITSAMIGARMSASTKVGRTRKKSVIRIRTPSVRPPTNPPTTPMTPPRMIVITVASSPMTIEIRVPCTVRLSMSRPISSVPSKWAALGGSRRPPVAVTAVWSGPTRRSGISASTVKNARIATPASPSRRRRTRRARWSTGRGADRIATAGAVMPGPAGRAGRRPCRRAGSPARPRC